MRDRLVWRIDDTTEVVEARIKSFLDSESAILAALQRASVPVLRAENARSELATFADVAAFVQTTSMSKLSAVRDRIRSDRLRNDAAQGWGEAQSQYQAGYGGFGGPQYQSGGMGDGSDMLYAASAMLEPDAPDERLSDIDPICGDDEGEEACMIRYDDEVEEAEVPPLLAAVLRCNQYDPDEYMPVVVATGAEGGALEQVGWANPTLLEALAPQLAAGKTCSLVELKKRRGEFWLAASAVPGNAPSGGDGVVGGEWGAGPSRRVLESPEVYLRPCVGVQLAPEVEGPFATTEVSRVMVEELVLDGLIPAAKGRNELQDVMPLPRGFGGAGFGAPSLLRLERAAMIYFGVPSFGVHVNGWVRNPNDPTDIRPYAMWVAKRSMSKATYPGLFDQMVAGGQPTGISFMDNVRKECEEEASLPPDVVAAVRPVGLVSYRYTTRKGLSTKVLAAYDVEMPAGLVPICADGEVEEFALLPIAEVLQSIREKLPLWKPNSALVVVDFAVRHGFVSPDEPGFVEIIHLLRAGGFGTE